MQLTVDSTTKQENPKPGFRSGDQWYSVQPPEYGLLPQRHSVIEFNPSQGNDGRQYFNANEVTLIQAAPPGGYKGAGGGGSSSNKGSVAKKGGYDNLGQQIGNAVTNATALICAGKVEIASGQLMQTLTKLATQLVKAGDDVRAAHEGAVQPTAPVVQQQAPQQQPVQRPAPVQQNAAPQQQAAPAMQGLASGAPDFDEDIPF